MKKIINSSKFKKAIQLAKKYYGRKKDASGTLIFDHCLRVAIRIESLIKDLKIKNKDKIIIAGLFHDLIEDTRITEKEILYFGKDVLSYTRQMTINFNKDIKQAVKPLYKIDDKVFLIKLADIYDNVSKSFFMIRKNGINWYKNFFLPLLNEYHNLIEYKKKKIKNLELKKIIDTLSEKILFKIIQLKEMVDFYEKLSLIENK